jgi:hypothetical protein
MANRHFCTEWHYLVRFRDGLTKGRKLKELSLGGTIVTTAVYRGFPGKIVPPINAGVQTYRPPDPQLPRRPTVEGAGARARGVTSGD